MQTSELARRIKDAEKSVRRLVSEEQLEAVTDADAQAHNGLSQQNGSRHTTPTDPEVQQRRHGVHQDAGSDDDDTEDELDSEDIQSVDALEDQFLTLEEEVATLVADVHDLALYTKLNITGFMKILKVRSSVIAVTAHVSPVRFHRNTTYVTRLPRRVVR